MFHLGVQIANRERHLKCLGDSEAVPGRRPHPSHLPSMVSLPAPWGHMCERTMRDLGRNGEEPEEPSRSWGSRLASLAVGRKHLSMKCPGVPFHLTRGLRHKGRVRPSNDPSASQLDTGATRVQSRDPRITESAILGHQQAWPRTSWRKTEARRTVGGPQGHTIVYTRPGPPLCRLISPHTIQSSTAPKPSTSGTIIFL